MAYADAAQKPDEMTLSDEQLLSILAAEKQSSIGFENASELEAKRNKALEYSRGVMTDVPSLPNRSAASSSDIMDSIETILPDLLEIFTGGEDVATFPPRGHEDEEAAKQETDYVNYVVFSKNDGFHLAYTAIKDALQVDTGVFEVWWQDEEATQEESFDGITAIQLQMLEQDGYTITDKTSLGVQADGVETFNVEAEYSYDAGCIKIATIDPANLSVAADTVRVRDATYACVRSYPRAQALLDQGFDPELVDKLTDHLSRGNDQNEQSRDLNNESQGTWGRAPTDPATRMMRTVEVHKHWIRLDADGDGKTELWRVQTDNECKVILDKRKVSRIGLACGTPFIQTHRFYGEALAYRLIEVQKIKTALIRMMLDSGYFAMNQRVEVAKDLSVDETIDDLIRNEPGVPIRVARPGAVNPVSAGQLGFDVQAALEYTATIAEQRTGIVRNAQGLNPDTLHDTAKGALALMTMAQKRVRMIARVLAETMFKDLYLNVHALAREHSTRSEKIRLNGKYVDIDPSQFGARADMSIEVGLGSGGKEAELINLNRLLEIQEKYVLARGGFGGSVQEQNFYNLVKRFTERSGFKAPEMFFTDPAQAPPEPPKPDPEMMKVQAQIEGDKAKLQAQTQNDQQKAAAQMEVERFKAGQEAELAKQKAVFEAQLAREKAAFEMEMEGKRMTMEMDMARQRNAHDMTISKEKADHDNELKKNRPGGSLSE